MLGDGEELVRPKRLVVDSFGSVASGTQVDIVGNKPDQSGPVVMSLDATNCFSDTRVTGQTMVMVRP